MSKPFIEVRNLRRTFNGFHAVDGISFTLEAGQVTGLIGANGAGKTTTMRILSTLDLPTEGTVHLGGVNVVEQPNDVRRRLGWMPDHFTAYKDTTVLQYLDFFARAQDLHGAERTSRLGEIAEFTNLHPLRDRPIDKLSKGQLQRVCLARALINDPEFLILDEPVAGLDPKARHEFKHLIHLLRDRGKTMLISSHILSELGEMCDMLLFMDRGKVVHHGDTHALRRGDTAAEISIINIVVAGPVEPAVKWLEQRDKWTVLEELTDGVKAEFDSGDQPLLREELKRMMADDIGVVDFHREERRLEETFMEMLRAPAGAPPAKTEEEGS
jgi:ABC-2 type transport system ATP-binding protein